MVTDVTSWSLTGVPKLAGSSDRYTRYPITFSGFPSTSVFTGFHSTITIPLVVIPLSIPDGAEFADGELGEEVFTWPISSCFLQPASNGNIKNPVRTSR